MGGEAVITLVGGSAQMLDEAFALAALCERLWSRFRSDSELSRVNANAGAPTAISPPTAALIYEMIEGFALTQGDFNPTLLPAVLEVGYRTSQVRDELVTELARPAEVFASLDGITLDTTSVTIPRGMTLEAGGIGKGFASDLIVAAARASGAEGVMVSLSGDVVVAGSAPDGDAWRLGVEDPFDTSAHVQVIRLVEGAVVTSSQLKNRFAGGHHLIDPKTQRSAETSAQTVSVIARSGARAEVMAKSGFLRPIPEFLDWLPRVGGAGMVIDADGAQLESTNWAQYR
jgi:thiamine biosynthesis lipoprotein